MTNTPAFIHTRLRRLAPRHSPVIRPSPYALRTINAVKKGQPSTVPSGPMRKDPRPYRSTPEIHTAPITKQIPHPRTPVDQNFENERLRTKRMQQYVALPRKPPSSMTGQKALAAAQPAAPC